VLLSPRNNVVVDDGADGADPGAKGANRVNRAHGLGSEAIGVKVAQVDPAN